MASSQVDPQQFAALSESAIERWSNFGNWDRVYFPSLVGVQIEELRVDYCRMRLPFRAELEQPMGVVHGGAIATLIDVCVVPAIGAAYESVVNYSTVDLHVQYHRALIQEDAVCHGWVTKRGRSVIFCEAEVIGASSDKVIAHGFMTYNVSPQRVRDS
jgi:uncharacterized protein (TIGR00369 family)